MADWYGYREERSVEYELAGHERPPLEGYWVTLWWGTNPGHKQGNGFWEWKTNQEQMPWESMTLDLMTYYWKIARNPVAWV